MESLKQQPKTPPKVDAPTVILRNYERGPPLVRNKVNREVVK